MSAEDCGTRPPDSSECVCGLENFRRARPSPATYPLLQAALKARRDKSPRWGTPSAVLGEIERGGATDIACFFPPLPRHRPPSGGRCRGIDRVVGRKRMDSRRETHNMQDSSLASPNWPFEVQEPDPWRTY